MPDFNNTLVNLFNVILIQMTTRVEFIIIILFTQWIVWLIYTYAPQSTPFWIILCNMELLRQLSYDTEFNARSFNDLRILQGTVFACAYVLLNQYYQISLILQKWCGII